MYINFGEQILCSFSYEMPFELVLPYDPMLTKRKKMAKIQKFEISKFFEHLSKRPSMYEHA